MAPSNKKKSKKARLSSATNGSGTARDGGSPSKKQPKKLSVDELIVAADHATSISNDTKHAITLYTIALHKMDAGISPESSDDMKQRMVDLYEKRADLHVQMQQSDRALSDYQKALHYLLQLYDESPTSTEGMETADGKLTPTKISNITRQAVLQMYVGQLSVGDEALHAYQEGIRCLRTALSLVGPSDSTVNPMNPSAVQELQQQLATACCNAAELFLTDLCYSENAEQQCEQYVMEALNIIPDHLDALQTMTSLRLSQKRNTEAISFVERVYNSMATGCQALATLVGLRNDASNDDESGSNELTALEHVQSLPPIEFRCQTIKLLLECADTLPYQEIAEESNGEASLDKRDWISTAQQQYYASAAVDVIGSCLAEQDEIVEMWLLLGDAMIFLEKELASQYWLRALDLLKPFRKELEEEQRAMVPDPYDDDLDEEDPLQQQLDSVISEMENLQERLEWAKHAGYDKVDMEE
jgi:tetratricopeptide (TPR) repeat protein